MDISRRTGKIIMVVTLILLILAIVAVGFLILWGKAILFGNADKPKFSDEEYDRFYDTKKAALEHILGPMHDVVGHAIIPFDAGGTVDMYYFPKHIPGTGFATMELIEPDGKGPKPNPIGTFELVAFTRKAIDDSQGGSSDASFNRIERRICGTFTVLGSYAHESVLSPGETCEIPGEKKGEPGKYLIFDSYSPKGTPFEIAGKKHCLLLCIEVFRSEMSYARNNGSAAVLTKLKEKGYYPYSDLDREAVW